jgi:Fe-S cluster biosynthesis and repair protein YggX
MDPTERIERFRRMTEADPDNDLAHFSLGKALAEAGRAEEALDPLKRAVELSPGFSKGFQLLGETQLRLGHRTAALETLRRGVTVADQRGDNMPRDAMAKLLTELGETPPEFAARRATEVVDVAGADLVCSRCGRPARRMDKAPFKGDLGQEVWDNVCQACWHEWVGVGTKVINEMGLEMSTPQAQQVYDDHMVEFLQLRE